MIWQHRSGALECGTVRLMGIVNVTPDSFYDGGRYREPAAAVDHGLALVAEGADILDVGGESSRPPVYGTAVQVSAQEECDRVLPVIEALRAHTAVPISVDTVKAAVARAALVAGADIVNDISALSADPEMVAVASRFQAGVVLMHRRGTPATMQQDTRYADLLGEVHDYLTARVAAAVGGGVALARLAVDPGLGFGKSRQGNLLLVRHIDSLADLGLPVLVGASRKSFVWRALGLEPQESLEGSLAVAAACVFRGVHVLRVHDVEATRRVVRLCEAILAARAEEANAGAG
ncbi:MAG: dihydropteroate synthase [Candidatus Latescibacterota bacterium]